FSIPAKEKLSSSAGMSIGHSWFHNYSGHSEHGMNVSLNFQPALDRYFRIDSSFSINFHLNERTKDELAGLARKVVFLAPQLTFGPEIVLPVFNDRLLLFSGAGLSFLVGINYSEKTNDATADFSPGFYARCGFDIVFTKFFGLGINSKYSWSMIHNPHILSFNLNLNFRY
ncbi:MAG TPA: hypothetical protein VLJ60_07265, partial [bacterium]|nr:hypothetical protein [bacterium]